MPAFVFLVASIGTCEKDEQAYARFNARDDAVDVEVTAADLGPPVTVELHSTTGTIIVGDATVDPGAGPVGTDHQVTVHVLPDFEGDVGKLTVITDSPGHGDPVEHTMVQDSADHGLWWRVLTSLGDEGETRTDTFTFGLWTPVEADEADTDAP